MYATACIGGHTGREAIRHRLRFGTPAGVDDLSGKLEDAIDLVAGRRALRSNRDRFRRLLGMPRVDRGQPHQEPRPCALSGVISQPSPEHQLHRFTGLNLPSPVAARAPDEAASFAR